MTYEDALKDIQDIDTFCRQCCNRCRANDWYCPTYCDVLKKAQRLDFDRIVKCYAKNEGDLRKVSRYIRRTKLVRKKGGY